MSERVYVVSQQLIANNIELISATSWAGYQQEGRGLILIDGGSVESAAPGGPLMYVSDKHMRAQEDGWPSEEMAGVVEKYNPEQEIIVVIKWRGEVGIYRLKSPIAPPLAYEQLRNVLVRSADQNSEIIPLIPSDS